MKEDERQRLQAPGPVFGHARVGEAEDKQPSPQEY